MIDKEKAYIKCPKCNGVIDATKPDYPAIGFDTYERECPDCGFTVIFPHISDEHESNIDLWGEPYG